MPQRKTITFAASAFTDLTAIRAWYREQQAAEAGERLIKEIIIQAERLDDSPESGRVVPEFAVANLREIILAPLRIVYRLDGKKIKVVRIWRSERILRVPE